MRKTKIICTLGPSSDDEKVMEELIRSGLDVARINFSHGDYDQHKKTIDTFRKVRDKMKVSAAVLMDTKGPEIRLGDIENGSIDVKKGDEIILTTDRITGSVEKVFVNYKELPHQVRPGTRILIDDGKISLQIKSIDGSQMICEVIEGGMISSHKGVNVPDTDLGMEYLSKIDKKDLLFGIKEGVDFVAASFIRTKDDVNDLRQFLRGNGGKDIKIISKIENNQGIENFRAILKASDGIMIARGDMGVEVDYEKLPGIQKKIIRECNEVGKIVITATQMLESMIENPTPTRAEITDVANAVFDGTWAIMLSGETAAGNFPIQSVKCMAKIAVRAETDAFDVGALDIDYKIDPDDITDAIGHAACITAHDLNASSVIAITKSGHTALRISKFKPKELIVAATPEKKVFHQMSLYWGVVPVMTDFARTWDELFAQASESVCRSGILKKGDRAVTTAGLPLHEAGNTNLIRVEVL